MTRLFFGASLSVFTAVFLAGACAHAFAQQTSAEFDDEFNSFKKKVAEAKAAAPPAKPDLPAAAPVAVPAPAAPSAKITNPLGPAGDLPVKGQMPATANALAVDMPADIQEQMDAQVAEQEKKLQEKTFDSALKQLMPLTPEQIRAMYGKFRESRQAAETPIQIPEAKTVVQTISLDPGQPPPVIHLAPGYVTTVTILDSSGAPWPVQDISFAGKFDVTPPENGGHIMRITPQSAHGVGNMSVRLVDMITPVIFTLTTGLDQADYRFDARIAKAGPLAKTPIIEFGGLGAVAGTDQNLVAVLDGTLPAGAEKLKMKGVDGRTAAWRLNGKVYLRTPLALLSPAWDSSVASADGTTVYTLNDTPVILLSDEGRMVRAHIAAADEVTP